MATKALLRKLWKTPRSEESLNKRFGYLSTINFDLKELYLKKGNHNEVPKRQKDR